MSQNLCAMCDEPTPADRGLMCPKHRAEDQGITDPTPEIESDRDER